MAFSIMSQRRMATATKLDAKTQVKQPFGAIGHGSSRRLRVMAFRDSQQPSGGGRNASTKTRGKKSSQPIIQPPRAPRNARENADSILSFVAIASLFLTGVLFVLPALLGGAPATTVPMQKGINKALNIKEPADTSGQKYAPGPGPAAAPGTPATQM